MEIDRVKTLTTLHAIDEWPAAFPSGVHDSAEPESGSKELAIALKHFIESCGVTAKHVSIAIDTTQLFLTNIPVSAGLQPAAVTDRISWELGQFFPDAHHEDFLTDYQILPNSGKNGVDDALIVGIRRRLESALERAVMAVGLTTYVVDADHFSAEIALRLNYPDVYSRFIALAGIKDGRLDISLLRNGVLQSYAYHRIDARADCVQLIASLSREIPGLASIVVFGQGLENELLQQLRKASAVVVEAMNPLRRVGISRTLKPAEYLSSPPYQFSAAIGVALRRD